MGGSSRSATAWLEDLLGMGARGLEGSAEGIEVAVVCSGIVEWSSEA